MKSKFTFERAVCESDLKPLTRLLLLTLSGFANRYGEQVYPAIGTIVQYTGMSERAVQKHIGIAESLGWILVENRFDDAGRQRSNVYHLAVPDSVLQDEREGAPNAIPGGEGARDAGGRVHDVHPFNIPDRTYQIKDSKGSLEIFDSVETYTNPGNEAVALLQEHWKSKIPIYFADLIRAKVSDIEKWKAVIARALESKWRMANVNALLDAYEKTGSVNGKKSTTRHGEIALKNAAILNSL